MKNNQFHVVKDPVHGTMQFTSKEHDWITPFIDSPQMQRLRHIKQLGMADLIFPGAVHTRFNHSLGCCYVGSQIANKIKLPEEDKQLVMIACLLHDIGHGPFSHAFEGVLNKKLIHHEAWTPLFLADYRNTQFFERYNTLNPNSQLDETKFTQIANMIMHKQVKRQVLADIVSSQLDADRLDYLLRDSYFCGVRYGEFDFKWMIHCLAIVEQEGTERLGITHKGVGVFESYLMARRLIMRNIGQLAKKLSIERYLINLLSLLSVQIDDNPAFSDIKKTKLGLFLSAANKFNQESYQTTDIDLLRTRFLESNYQTYKQLCDYDVFWVIRNLTQLDENTPLVVLADRIQNRVMPIIVRLDYAAVDKMHHELNEFKRAHAKTYQDWQLQIISAPHTSYTEDDPVLVYDEDGGVKPITSYSLMVSALSDQDENISFLMVDKLIAEDKPIKQLIEKFHLSNKVNMHQSSAVVRTVTFAPDHPLEAIE